MPGGVAAGLVRLHRAHAWLDVLVVVAVLVATNMVAHFTTVWASIATVPIAALVLVAMMRHRGMHWSELGLSPRHWKRGTLYSLGAVGLVVGVVAVGIALPFTRQFFAGAHWARFDIEGDDVDVIELKIGFRF